MLAEFANGYVRAWYQKQTPCRLTELTGLPMLEAD